MRALLTITFFLATLATRATRAEDVPSPPPDGQPYSYVWLPESERVRFRNPPYYGGSCVQCSIAMCGVAMNCPAAENLLWRSEYGSAILGGSGPDRVKSYCDARQIAAWNVYGSQAVKWAEAMLQQGKPVAGTWNSNHCILYCGFSGDSLNEQSMILKCDNNSPSKLEWISHAEWHKKFCAFGGGGWAVILKGPTPPGRANYWEWWEK